MSIADDLVLQRFDGPQARGITETVADVQARGYADAIATGNPFESTEAFMERFDVYSVIPGFSLVLATLGGQPVGQAFGWPIESGKSWWTGLALDDGDLDEFTTEDGTRTFAFSELMVDKALQGHGIAGALYRELVLARPEQRATWLVNPANDNAYAIYRHWGARKVGTIQPSWEGAPQFDVLTRDLQ
jgi:GNAT superfamily N-acetyltransferase